MYFYSYLYFIFIVIFIYISFLFCIVIFTRYNIKFVSDLRQVGDFLRFSPPIKLTATI